MVKTVSAGAGTPTYIPTNGRAHTYTYTHILHTPILPTALLYRYRLAYAETLLRWGYMEERMEVLKHVQSPPGTSTVPQSLAHPTKSTVSAAVEKQPGALALADAGERGGSEATAVSSSTQGTAPSSSSSSVAATVTITAADLADASLELVAVCSRCKTATRPPNSSTSATGTGTRMGPWWWCAKCKGYALHCALCSLPVRGQAIFCHKCGHGGHAKHMKGWFSSNRYVFPVRLSTV